MPGIFGIIDSSLVGSSQLPAELLASARLMLAAMNFEAWYVSALTDLPAVGACVGAVEIGPPQLIAGSIFALATGERAATTVRVDSVETAFADLRGRCAGVVAGKDSQRIKVFNDRFGRERLFVHTSGSRTFFASEAKAILAACPETRTFDPRGLAELLACGCTLTRQSLFLGVEVLEPGTCLTFGRTGVERHRYVTAGAFEAQRTLGPADFHDAFVSAMRDEVRDEAAAMPRAALSLTGGLDSRMVAACLGRDRPIPTFTFGSMYRTTGDVAVGQAVARECGLSHQVIELGQDFLTDFAATFERSVYASDGYLGLSGAAELHVNRLARAIAPARMTGNWGGEMMRGVRAFKFSTPKGDFLRADTLANIAASEAAFSPEIADPLSGTLFHQIPLQGYGRYAIERSQVVTRTPFLAPRVVEALYQAAPETRRANAAAAAVMAQQPGLLTMPTDAGVVVTRPATLRRHWRRLVIKAEYMTSHGAPDWVARAASVLPAAVLEQRFLGVDKFYHFRHWMRHQLAPTVMDVLAQQAPRLGTWIDLSRVRHMAERHCRGKANHTDALDKVMTLVVAERQLLDEARWSARNTRPAGDADPKILTPWA
jgi:asparagine synthase (glutamine-hydrolysing)